MCARGLGELVTAKLAPTTHRPSTRRSQRMKRMALRRSVHRPARSHNHTACLLPLSQEKPCKLSICFAHKLPVLGCIALMCKHGVLVSRTRGAMLGVCQECTV